MDIAMLSNKIDSFFLKEDEDGSIEEVKKVIACLYGVSHVGDVTRINHRSTFLDAEARLIPPCNDKQCLGIHGCVDKLHMLTLNNHKHVAWTGQVEGVDEVLQASNSGIYQSSSKPQSRQNDVLSIPAQSGAASQRSTAAVGDKSLEQVCGTRRFARLADESAKVLKGANLFSKKELFADDIQDFKRYLEESLYASVEVSGVTQVDESASKVGGQFFLSGLRGAHNMTAKLSRKQLER